MSPPCLLSIVVPTRERYATLLPVLDALLTGIPDADVEWVIQDNTPDNAAAVAFLERRGDRRVSYRNEPAPMSIVDNTEAALSRVQGTFVTFIGDDDLVSPSIVAVARQLRDSAVDAVIYRPAYYWWSSVVFAKPSRYHQPGAFWWPSTAATPRWRLLDAKAELERVLAAGAVSLFDLPRLYHGLVRSDALLRCKARTGRFVNGASPDMALAVGLALVMREYLWIDTPLTVFGASRDSGGGFTAQQRHHGRLEDQRHLPAKTVEHWNPRLPRVWSEHTVYPQTVGEVLAEMQVPDTISYARFYASMAVNEPHLRGLLLPLAARYFRRHPRELATALPTLLRKSVGRAMRRLGAATGRMPFTLDILDSPHSCMGALAGMPPPVLGPVTLR